MLYAVVLFAMFPVLRHRLQVRTLFRWPSSFGYHIGLLRRAPLCPLPLWSFIAQADTERTSLTFVSSMGSIGRRTITLPGIPYDPSICVIAACHRPPIAIGCMDLRGGSKLGSIRRPSGPRLGTKVQKVRDSLVSRAWDGHAHLFRDSELKGSWDVAVPRVNRRRRGKSVAMMDHLHQQQPGR